MALRGDDHLHGGLYALAGLVALGARPGGALARAFAKFALLAAAFFVTIFDTHTTRTMVPLFHATFAWIPFALVGLALRLPDDVPLVARHPWILRRAGRDGRARWRRSPSHGTSSGSP